MKLYKHILVLVSLLFFTNFSISQCCDYTLDGYDSFGDGWNGASVDVYIDGVLQENFTFSMGSSSSTTFTLCDGEVLELSFNSGLYDFEISIDISNPNGVLASFTEPAQGVFYSQVGDCSAIPPEPEEPGGTSCADLSPICTDSGLNFTANSGGTDAVITDPGNNYDCLITQPNPSWYYLEVSDAGNIDMSLTADSDIDFIIYGPYTDLADAEANCNNYGPVVDCSFSPTNNETPSIPNAQVGEVYVMLITNYANVVQDISLTQTGGTGATDCSIVEPCTMTYFEANISACTAGTYDITGSIDYNEPPTSGDLIVEDCNGNQTVVASAPFATNGAGNGSYNYSLTGLSADGAGCDVTAYFTDASACTQNLTYTAPSCACAFTLIDVTIGACDPSDNTFDITGTVEYQDPPATGDLIVEDCYGNQVVVASAPFDGSDNFTLADLDSDGTTDCALTAYFTDDTGCDITIDVDYPENCLFGCPADAGTYSNSLTGNSTSTGTTYHLCFGDQLDITGNGDFVPPEDIGPTTGGWSYDPGVILLIYDCPPTMITPPDDITADPCFVGVASTADQAWSILNDVGDNSTVYFVPLTMYSIEGLIYSNVPAGEDPCYDTGPVYEITFLQEITTTQTQDCQAGTATVTVNGGMPSFDGSDFTASNLSPATATFDNTTAGDGGTITISGLEDGDAWSFDITDDQGCPITVSGTFTGTEDPSFTYPSAEYCANDADPTPTVTGVTGGTFTAPGGVSINASTGAIDLSASTPGGPYTVTYTTPDPTCFDEATFEITINPVPVIDVPDASICSGTSTDLTASGADTYTWTPTGSLSSGTGTTVTATPTSTTTYTVTGEITATGCQGQTTVTVTILPDPTITGTFDVCVNNTTQLSGSGTPDGTTPWTSSDPTVATVDNTGLVTGVAAGTTDITYTNSDGCQVTETITVNPLPTVVADDVSTCETSTVDLTASGADTYTWSPGTYLSGTTGATVTFTPGASTDYTVTGTDVNGCVNTDVASVTVLANAAIVASADVTICDGENTDISASGGVSYDWDNALGAGDVHTVSPTATTTYTVTGTDASGCIGTDDVTVTVNPLPMVDDVTDIEVCANDAIADIVFTGSAGASFDWTNDNTTVGLGANGTGDIAEFTATNTGATPQTATVTVTPTASGCTGTPIDFTITVNPLPPVNAGADQEVCDGEQVTLEGSGASTYSWDNGISDNTAFTPTVGTTTYTVTGTDANGCENTDQVDVTVNPLPVVNAGADQEVCDGTSVTLAGSGADTYTWDNGVTDGQAFTPSVGTVTYTVTGTDVNGCENTDQVTVTVNPNPSPTIDGATEYCTGTYSTLSTPNSYAGYSWSTGETTATVQATEADNPITVTVTDANGCQGTSPEFTVTENSVITYNSTITICDGESATIHGNMETTAGVYSQTYTLPTGCDSTSNIELIVNALPPVDAGADQEVCDETATTLSGSGADNYSWDNGVTDGVSFTQAVGTITYTVTGTDAATGCQNTDVADITVNPLPVVDAGPDQEVCEGTQVTLSGSGASTYVWNNGVTDGQAFTQNPGTVTYAVTGTDVNGCEDTDQVDVTVNPTPTIAAGPDQEVCEGEQVTLSGSGAGAGGSYAWDNGITDNTAFTPNVGTTTYTVTGTDANGCESTDDVDVTVNPLPVVNAGADQEVCEGTQVTLSASGASTYVWNNGVTDGQAFTQNPGTVTYTVTGTDVNGCENTDDVDVTVNPNPTINAGPDQEVCEGEQVTLSGSGAGTGGSYAWNNGVTDGVAFTPSIGTVNYTVVGTDVNGCEGTDDVIVVVNPIPTIIAGNDLSGCEGDSFVLTASGAGTGGSYQWDNGVTQGQSFTPNVGTTTYTVTGTSAEGCENTDELSIDIEAEPEISFTFDEDGVCAPVTVTFTNTTVEDVDNCTWYMDDGGVVNGCGSVEYTFTQAGTYGVMLEAETVANGCSSSTYYEDIITVAGYPNAAFMPSPTSATSMDTEIDFENESTGAISYEWDFGDNTQGSIEVNPSHEYDEEEFGNYVVTLVATNEAGCTDTTYRTVRIVEELIYYVPNTFTPDKDQFNETFHPVFTSGYDPFDYHLTIFNRWGQIVFESHNAEIGWSGHYGAGGKLCQDGVYTWKIEFKVTADDSRQIHHGHVNLIR